MKSIFVINSRSVCISFIHQTEYIHIYVQAYIMKVPRAPTGSAGVFRQTPMWLEVHTMHRISIF